MLAHGIRDRLSPRSDTAICSDALRFLLWTCQLAAACNGAWNFIGTNFYSSTLAPLRDRGISPMLLLDPYYRRLACPFGHSRHRHFIDPRPNAHSHLWLALHLPLFPLFTASRASAVSRLHRAFDPGSFPPTPIGVLGERFRALLYHSTLQSISCCLRLSPKAPRFYHHMVFSSTELYSL